MAATAVIEQGSFESGARLAGLVVQALEQFEPVRVILRDDGPLQPWLAEHVHGRIAVCNRGNFPYEAPLAERCSAAASFLESDPGDLVYVFGLGASDFAIAAKSQDRRVVLHACEPAAQIEHLLARDQAKLDCASFCDALITAEDCGADSLSRLFGRTPARVRNAGLRIDVEWLNRVCSEGVPDAANDAGERLNWTNGFVVGGGGTTGEAAEFFRAIARECPDLAFAWFDRRPGTPAGQGGANGHSVVPPANLYAVPRRENVWPSVAALGAYVVCGRERDLTLPLAAAARGIPVVGFTAAGTGELCGRHGILCHGEANPVLVGDLARKLAAAAPSAGDPDGAAWRRLDIEACVDPILHTLADVRLMETD